MSLRSGCFSWPQVPCACARCHPRVLVAGILAKTAAKHSKYLSSAAVSRTRCSSAPLFWVCLSRPPLLWQYIWISGRQWERRTTNRDWKRAKEQDGSAKSGFEPFLGSGDLVSIISARGVPEREYAIPARVCLGPVFREGCCRRCCCAAFLWVWFQLWQTHSKEQNMFFRARCSQFGVHFEQTRPNRVFFWLLAAALLMINNAAIPLPGKTHVRANRQAKHPQCSGAWCRSTELWVMSPTASEESRRAKES